MDISGSENPMDEKSFEELQEFIDNSHFAHYIGMLFPLTPGVAECIATIEHTHFKPNTPRNELLFTHFVRWNKIAWIIVSIPTEDKGLVEDIAKQCRLEINNGVPVINKEVFPVNCNNIFTFDNDPDHPIHRNDPAINKAIFEAESDIVRDIWEGKYKQ